MKKNLMWTLKQLHFSLEQGGKQHLQEMGLSPTQRVVLHYLLTHRQQDIYGVDLHAELGISKSSVSSALKTLRQNGYLTLRDDPQDDRKKQIVLTEKAFSVEQAIQRGLELQQKQLCRGIPEEHLAWLEQDLEIMLRNQKKQTEGSL